MDTSKRVRNERKIRSVPLVDLHLHLEGAIDSKLASVFFRQNNPHRTFGLNNRVGWAEFSKTFQEVAQCLDHPTQISKLLLAIASNHRRQRIMYSEIIVSFSVLRKVNRSMTIGGICDALTHGRHLAKTLLGVIIEFHIGISRGDEVRDSEGMLREILTYPDSTELFCAINICGNEERTVDKTSEFAGCARIARKAGLRVVVHCGEFDAPFGTRLFLSVRRCSTSMLTGSESRSLA